MPSGKKNSRERQRERESSTKPGRCGSYKNRHFIFLWFPLHNTTLKSMCRQNTRKWIINSLCIMNKLGHPELRAGRRCRRWALKRDYSIINILFFYLSNERDSWWNCVNFRLRRVVDWGWNSQEEDRLSWPEHQRKGEPCDDCKLLIQVQLEVYKHLSVKNRKKS